MEPGRAAWVPQEADRVLAERIRLAPVGGEAQRVSTVHHSIDGQNVHFLHVRSPEPGALPLIVCHGYPGSVVEFLNIIGPLTDPASYGGNAADAFHVVAPSLPGFGFSTPVRESGWEMARTARAFAELMNRLGYERYGAQGGDVGSGIIGMLAGFDPDRVVGVHTNSDPLAVIGALDYLPEGAARLGGLAKVDKAAVEQARALTNAGSGYLKLQSNRPFAAMETPDLLVGDV